MAQNPPTLSLDQHLSMHGFQLTSGSKDIEGYLSEAQKNQFIAHLQKHPNIRSIAEVGLNGGHSAENFFQNCPQLETFVSFDIQEHSYAKVAKEYFYKRYPNRFSLVEGDSAKTVPQYIRSHVGKTFDLIYIDGSHLWFNCLQDIVNFHYLAHPHSLLWIDDYNYENVQTAIDLCVQMGLIQIVNIHTSNDLSGTRVWSEARYLPISQNVSFQIFIDYVRNVLPKWMRLYRS